MKFFHSLLFINVVAMLSCMAGAVEKDINRSSHSESAASVPANEFMTQEAIDKMDSQMHLMHEMHDKMMNAKTPEEHKALMAEHMKAMRGGMAMMNTMSMRDSMHKNSGMGGEKNAMMKDQNTMKCDFPADMKTQHQLMEKRIQLLETTLQMMMDSLNLDSYDDYVNRSFKK